MYFKKISSSMLFLLASLFLVVDAAAADTATDVNAAASAISNDNYAADRKQLLSMMAEIERGINEGKIELFTHNIDETARVIFLNGEVAIGPNGVKDYFNRMVGPHEGATLSKYITHAKVADHARFYGSAENPVAVANGTMEDEFTPHARGIFKFSSKWSASFAKKNNEWKILSLHFSTNTFNNVLTEELKNKIMQVGIGAFLAGLVLAFLFGMIVRKRKTNV